MCCALTPVRSIFSGSWSRPGAAIRWTMDWSSRIKPMLAIERLA
jgi:hypothetical protein